MRPVLINHVHPFLMTGSSWSKRVWNGLRCNWSDFHTRYRFWVEKSVGNGFKVLWISILLHSWSSVPLDQKESETQNDAIYLIFTQQTKFGSKNRFVRIWKCSEWISASILDQPSSPILDDRFLLIKKSLKLITMQLIWFSPKVPILGRKIDWKWFYNTMN